MLFNSNTTTSKSQKQSPEEAEIDMGRRKSYTCLKLSFKGYVKDVFFETELTYKHLRMIIEIDQIGNKVDSFSEFLEKCYALFERYDLSRRPK